MSALNPSRRNSRSPFDAIRKTDENSDGSEFEYWSGRELQTLLGYDRWERFQDAIDRARAACRANGDDVTDHFRGAAKMVSLGSGAERRVEDVQLTRYGCYMTAMSGDARKPEIAAALRYFAVQTRRAEILLPPITPEPPPVLGAWYLRLLQTLRPHRAELVRLLPDCWTVLTALAPDLIVMEGVLHDHLLPTQSLDRPDVSVGGLWARAAPGLGCRPSPGRVPLHLPDQRIRVGVLAYHDSDLPAFRRWFNNTYLPERLHPYLDAKPELIPFGPLPRASAADHASVELGGRPAVLPARTRAALVAAGGIARAAPGIAPGTRRTLPAARA